MSIKEKKQSCYYWLIIFVQGLEHHYFFFVMLISKSTAVAALLLCSAGPYSACTAAIGWLCRTGLICVCRFDLLTVCVNKFVYAHGSCSWGKACKKEELVFMLPSVLRNWHCAAFTAVCICITISCCYRDLLWVGLYHFLLWKGNKNWFFLIAPLWKPQFKILSVNNSYLPVQMPVPIKNIKKRQTPFIHVTSVSIA